MKSTNKAKKNKKVVDKKDDKLKKKKQRKKKFKKTKLGKLLYMFSDNKNTYSFSEVFGITIVSLIVGVFACLCAFSLIFGGRNYFKLSKEIAKFYDAYETIASNYYGDVDKDELIDSAINGMIDSVGDAYTSYSDNKSADSFEGMVSGTYEGIGCTIRQADGNISVVDVYDDSPSSKAGIKSGDIIKTVDDQNALELGVTKLSEYIKGKEKVTMVIVRNEKEITVEVKRDVVEIPTVTSKLYEVNGKKIGYIYISLFSYVASNQFKNRISDLEKQNIDGLVIDVRGNSGGYLSTVTEIASTLLPKGKIIYQIQNDDKNKVTKDKTSEKREYPIALLADETSASASEILAAVIKESYGGYVVGNRTYGKGTVQQVKKLNDGSMIKYTVEKWLTPLGNWINEEGVEPTHLVKLDNAYFKNPSEETDNQLQKALELVSK